MSAPLTTHDSPLTPAGPIDPAVHAALLDERDALAAELAALKGQVAAAAAELAGVDLLRDAHGAGVPDIVHHADHCGLPIDAAERLARRVLLQAYRGSQEVAHQAVIDAFRSWREETRRLIGAELAAAPLAGLADIDIRTLNTLAAGGVQTVGQLVALEGVLDQLCLPNYGPETARLLAKVCRQLRPRLGALALKLPLPAVPLVGGILAGNGEPLGD